MVSNPKNHEPQAAAATGSDGYVSLYQAQKKIYPRSVTGLFAKWRWFFVFATQIFFYGMPWLQWGGRQALLFDLEARRFYIFGLVLYPQDVIYLSGILIISAMLLFLFTAVAGRQWCGYACPQTVYTEIYLWMERKIEGDRSARMRLDAAPMSAAKFGRKAAKQLAWIAFGLWTGFTFVGYFTPIRELAGHVLSWSLGPWETFWIFFYGFATYGNGGYMREQVCKYMCPYARFQSAMFDKDTLIVTYDAKRGEPRGARSKKADPKALGLGDCVNCTLCVQVCPTGIDIRNGLQYECIACGACIDACDEVMAKMGYPKGLIRYSTLNAIDGKPTRVLRPRVVVYGLILLGLLAGWTWGVLHRSPLIAEVLRDRNALYQQAGDHIANSYTLKLVNKTDTAQTYRVRLEADPALHLRLAGEPLELQVPAGAVASQAIEIDAPANVRGRHPLALVLEDGDGSAKARVESAFFGPI